MSDNRIQMPGKPPESDQPININMTSAGGVVQILFDPPAVRLKFTPRSARLLAVALLGHADAAENPPPIIENPPPPTEE